MKLEKLRSRKMTFSLLFLLGIILTDLLAGTLIINIKGGYLGSELMNEVRNLNSYYNHGFVSNSSGIANYGPMKPWYYINSLGMKDASVRYVGAKDVKHRLLFVGDSFTEGVGYPWDSTFCGLLSQKPDFAANEVLNAGVAGFSPKVYFLRADYLINVQKLDVNDMYCFLDFSDVFDELVYQDFEPEVSSKFRDFTDALRFFYRRHSLVYNLYNHFLLNMFLRRNKLPDGYGSLYWTKSSERFSEETNFEFARYHQNWLNADMLNLPVTQKALDLTRFNLLRLKSLCQQHNIKFHLIIYPNAPHVFSRKDEQFETLVHDNRKYVMIWQDFALQNNIDFINLFPLFASDNRNDAILNRMDYYIAGDIHWNFEGHKKVADSLYEIIGSRQ